MEFTNTKYVHIEKQISGKTFCLIENLIANQSFLGGINHFIGSLEWDKQCTHRQCYIIDLC